jgi:Tol biopolymer transport system component/DNA-binding winged helix-turn-helix (wHTH) protein
MNRPNEIRSVFIAVDLAREPDFALGPLSVRPSLRRVVRDGREEAVQPRVMKVLVALARAKGTVVSREELVETCWDGVIIGDDSITHAIAKVRLLADCRNVQAFEIETIPRVGYRLRQPEADRTEVVAPPTAPPVSPLHSISRRGIGMIVVAITTAAVAAVAALYFNLRPEPQWIVAESHLPFISTPAIERYPALSPDGTMIAYSEGQSISNRHIALRLLNSDDPIQLTHDAHDASAPAWSPDGRTVAFVIFEEGHPCRIMEIPMPAGRSHQIGQCRVSERSTLAFDHSGRALYYSDAPAQGAADRIVRLDLDNGRVSAVTHPGGNVVADGAPSISPDGRVLLYLREFGWQESQIRLLSLSDATDRIIASFKDGDTNAAWSADGQTIFISRSRGNENALWAYPAKGGDPWRILSTGEAIERLSAGPNGLLALELEYPGGQLVRVTPHSDQQPKPIDAAGLKTWCVDYASDGTFLATGWHSGNFGVWISDAKGSLRELFRITDGLACAVRWSPDGTRFAYLQWRPGGFDVPVMTRDGAPIARVFYPGNDSGRLDWTADGKSILTSRKEKRGWRIWRTDLATNKSLPVTTYGWRDPRVHENMLFAEKDGAPGIWRIDGTPRRLTDGPAPEASDVYIVAGDRLIYSDTTDPDHPVFSAENIAGGPKDRIAPLPRGQTDFVFGVDPKSGDIVYTMGNNDTDIGLLRLAQR